MITALVSSVLTFLITFFFTFIFGCVCGICFLKKCKRPGTNDSQPQLPMTVYENVLYEDILQQEQTLELKQNVAYDHIALSTSIQP